MRAAVALILALSLLPATAGGATPPPRAVSDPPPEAAAAAALGLLDAAAQQARAFERALDAEEPALTPPALTADEATAIARTPSRLREWIADRSIARTAARRSTDGATWEVEFIRADGEEEVIEALVIVSDETGEVSEVRTGPQVAWMMARGYPGAFGRAITRPTIWGGLTAVFLLSLIDPRRLVSWRTLDLLALVSFSASLAWFTRGEIFTSVPLAYPPLAYVAARLTAIGLARRRASGAPAAPRLVSWAPTWLLGTLLAVSLALRYGLNAFDSNVIDVGYAGVIGADRIAHGLTPYGNATADCGNCDTYGPLTYIAYVPFEAALPWTGTWDALPAAHGAATMFDILAVAGMFALGWMLSGTRLGIGLALAWAAMPFTAYALANNSNDSLVAACLIWGLVLLNRPLGRGLLLGLAIAAKLAPALLVPLWAGGALAREKRARAAIGVGAGLAVAAVLTGWVLLLDGPGGIATFAERTVGYQLTRESPFSIWGQIGALAPVQWLLIAILGAGALVLFARPSARDPLSLIALSGALLAGLELTMTHWFYLYIVWFLPFALAAMIPAWPRRAA